MKAKEAEEREKLGEEGGLAATSKRLRKGKERYTGAAEEEDEQDEQEQRMVKKQKVSEQVEGLVSTIELIGAEKDFLTKENERLTKENKRLVEDNTILRDQLEAKGEESIEGL